MSLNLEDLRRMRRADLHAVMCRAHPLDPAALESAAYRGVDLSLPGFMHRLLWETFVKEFVRDAGTGHIRGWNVRLKQTGIEGEIVPLRRKDGARLTFGHYVVREVTDQRFHRAGAADTSWTIAARATHSSTRAVWRRRRSWR
jgi:hypothetical protein